MSTSYTPSPVPLPEERIALPSDGDGRIAAADVAEP